MTTKEKNKKKPELKNDKDKVKNCLPIINEIGSFYFTYKEAEKFKDVVKARIQKEADEYGIGRQPVEMEGFFISYQIRPSYTIDQELKEILYDEYKLPVAVKVEPKYEKQYDIKHARMDLEYSVRPSFKQPKAIKDLMKANCETFDNSLHGKEIRELLAVYKQVTDDIKKYEDQYARCKYQLLKEMKKEKLSSLVTEIGTFTVKAKKQEYDIDQIYAHGFVKKEMDLYYTIVGDTVIGMDLFTNDQFQFPVDETYEHEKQILSFEGDSLLIDGEPLENHHTLEEQDKTIHRISGSIEINPMDFFYMCDLSSTKLTEMTNEGTLPLETLKKYRKPTGLEKAKPFLEVISVDNDSKRKQKMRDDAVTYSLHREKVNREVQTMSEEEIQRLTS